MPAPVATDISSLIRSPALEAVLEVKGQVITTPQRTRSGKTRFELQAIEATEISDQKSAPKAVTGLVYVTVPQPKQDLYPGLTVKVIGTLYLPEPAKNPGGFDFQAYLKREGIFSGLRGQKFTILETDKPTPPLLWWVRQRIAQSQIKGAGDREGALLTAMVMGRNGVDVPYDIQDTFAQIGLSHVLAASGFQVSLLVGVVLTLTKRLKSPLRLLIGISTIVCYVSLTGGDPPALRAGLMGFVALLALTLERKVKPIAALLFAAVLMLLWNPLWIWNLGFQLTFLATLGLMVTVPILEKWLDWLPPALAALITVPTAAYLWLLPLQLYAFSIVSPYSIPINILTSPLILFVSLGGMISALAGLIYPIAGSFLAWLLFYPTHFFIQLAEFGTQLPGSVYATGKITVLQVIILYSLFLLIWWKAKWQRYWWVAGIVGLSLVALPAWATTTHQLRVTILDTTNPPVLVLQDRGQVGLINGGSESAVQFTVLPFLRQQGVNQIDWAVDLNLDPAAITGWQALLSQMPIQNFYSRAAKKTSAGAQRSLIQAIQSQQGTAIALTIGQPISFGAAHLKLLNSRPIALQIQLQGQTWILLQNLPPQSDALAGIAKALPPATLLWWSGHLQETAVLEKIQPKTVIVSGNAIPPQIQTWLQQQQTKTYLTDKEGAIRWTNDRGFQTSSDATDTVQ
jgi:competence protein ComEC